MNKIEFSARNLTSNAGLFLLLKCANKNGIFDLIDHDLVFDNVSTNKVSGIRIRTGEKQNYREVNNERDREYI